MKKIDEYYDNIKKDIDEPISEERIEELYQEHKVNKKEGGKEMEEKVVKVKKSLPWYKSKWTYAAGGIVIGAVGYFGYKKLFGDKIEETPVEVPTETPEPVEIEM